MSFLQSMEPMLVSISQSTEKLHLFRLHIEGIRDMKGLRAFEEASALLEVIDASIALSNRHWFCYKDMEQHLRKALS
ncbi:MAG: hypothetical protein EOP06_14800 [Proteobacteria bacterium]|nr:MAG: hypothetical protein EOP06_14800 [Pseudomonadota bacterium]